MRMKRLFDPSAAARSPAHRRVHAMFELAMTIVDFMAALLFVIGSVLFFWESTAFVGTWLFLLGSVCFALSPTLKLIRELRLLRMGRDEAPAADGASAP